MLLTNHVLAGAVVGLLSPTPTRAFVTGVASHAAMDAVPHYGVRNDDDFLPVAVADGLIGLATLVTVARFAPGEHRTRVVAGMLGGCFPDADKPSELFFGRSPFPAVVDDLHKRIQRESHRRFPQEVAVAAGTALVVRLLLRRRTAR